MQLKKNDLAHIQKCSDKYERDKRLKWKYSGYMVIDRFCFLNLYHINQSHIFLSEGFRSFWRWRHAIFRLSRRSFINKWHLDFNEIDTYMYNLNAKIHFIIIRQTTSVFFKKYWKHKWSYFIPIWSSCTHY